MDEDLLRHGDPCWRLCCSLISNYHQARAFAGALYESRSRERLEKSLTTNLIEIYIFRVGCMLQCRICISNPLDFFLARLPPLYVIPRVVVSVAAFELGAYLEYAKCSKLTEVCMASASF